MPTKTIPIHIQLNLKVYHEKSNNTQTKKRANTLFYHMKLFYYNMILDTLDDPTIYDYLDNIDTYIDYSKQQKKQYLVPPTFKLKR